MLKLINSFADARALYNEILNKYPSHPEVRLAWLGLGDATLAQNARTLEAAAIFERLYSLPDMPPAARAEAAFKWSFALERAGKTSEANEVRWLTSFRTPQTSGARTRRGLLDRALALQSRKVHGVGKPYARCARRVRDNR